MTVLENIYKFMNNKWFCYTNKFGFTIYIYLREDHNTIYNYKNIEFYTISSMIEDINNIDGYYLMFKFHELFKFKELEDDNIINILNADFAKKILNSKV